MSKLPSFVLFFLLVCCGICGSALAQETSEDKTAKNTTANSTTDEHVVEKTEAEKMIDKVKELFPEKENKGLVSDIGKVIKAKKSKALITNLSLIHI